MKTSESYLPEGSYMVQPAVRQAFSTLGALRQAQDEGRILEAVAQRCTAAHDLLFDLGIAQGSCRACPARSAWRRATRARLPFCRV